MVVRMIFDLYARQRLGARAVAAELNERGHRSSTGREWSEHHVLRILNSRIYLGELTFRDTTVTDTPRPHRHRNLRPRPISPRSTRRTPRPPRRELLGLPADRSLALPALRARNDRHPRCGAPPAPTATTPASTAPATTPTSATSPDSTPTP
ncbi:recombinase family protein [Nocardia terpenica]|uniref:recombinase family protein n=1 Tax=Nocardia terpenica TaxID=455432 RepID=UPI003A5BABDD